MEYDLDKEERAYALLQWGSPAPLAPFDEELAVQGFYSAAQRKRSDAALDEWEKSNPYETSSELSAFKELESIGVLTQADFYSPAKASRKPDGLSNSPAPQTSYLDDLKQRNNIQSGGTPPESDRGISASVHEGSQSPKGTRRSNSYRASRRRLDVIDEESRGSTSS